MFAAIDRVIIWTTAIIVAVLMLAMVGSIIAGVFFRYVLNDALPWPEEFARFAQIWVSMLGAGLVIRYGGHIAVRFIAERVSGPVRRMLDLANTALIAVFLGLLIVFGADMSQRVERQTSPALELSMTLPNLALPIGAGLMLYHFIVLALRREGSDRGPPRLRLE